MAERQIGHIVNLPHTVDTQIFSIQDSRSTGVAVVIVDYYVEEPTVHSYFYKLSKDSDT